MLEISLFIYVSKYSYVIVSGVILHISIFYQNSPRYPLYIAYYLTVIVGERAVDNGCTIGNVVRPSPTVCRSPGYSFTSGTRRQYL